MLIREYNNGRFGVKITDSQMISNIMAIMNEPILQENVVFEI